MNNAYVERLTDYINSDLIYQNYKNGNLRDNELSDFDKFCISHCEDIENILEYINNKNKNIKFYYNKQDFDKNDGVKLTDSKIQDMIDDVIKRLDSSKGYSFSATGDTIVIGFKWEEEVDVYVCKNYEHAKAWLDENGNWEKMDWLKDYKEEEIRKKYEEILRDEFMKDRKPQYNPRKEV